MLRRTCKKIAETNDAFAGMTFTPHDFRRLFATDIVNGGLPIHIGAALLGHVNLQTTQGYVAVFAEDIVNSYQEFLNHRRSLRPEDEYVDITSEEWAEFEEHFDKRKVEGPDPPPQASRGGAVARQDRGHRSDPDLRPHQASRRGPPHAPNPRHPRHPNGPVPEQMTTKGGNWLRHSRKTEVTA